MTVTTTNNSDIKFTLVQVDQDVPSERRFTLHDGVCEVGRGSDCGFRINSGSVSKRHARFIASGMQLIVEDLGSTNGTFVNGKRVSHSALVDRDIVQFANATYRIERCQAIEHDGTVEEGLAQWAQTLISFDTLLNEKRVIPFYQPIFTMDRSQVVGFEVLARSNLPELTNPAAMFGVAERLGQQAALSELMRSEGMRVAAIGNQVQNRFYLNTHPIEVVNERMIASLVLLRHRFPAMGITIEIHEGAVTDLNSMKLLRQTLRDLDMHLAYDDFGAGQGRLLELAEVPPEVLKFDMQLIRGIDKAPASRQELLRSLVRYATELGTTPLAEGVETEEEHAACVALGFQLGQGYLYGRPAVLE
jgi:EAL domain-containing protein (putative c-di-GMP-specific phosphodiesterase class I)